MKDEKLCPLTLQDSKSLTNAWVPDCCGDKGNFVDADALLQLVQSSTIDKCPCCQQTGIRTRFQAQGYQVPDINLLKNFASYVASNNIEGIEQCLQAGCSVNLTEDVQAHFANNYSFFHLEDEWCPLLYQAITHDAYKAFTLLLQQKNINVNQATSKGNTPLLAAVERAANFRDYRYFSSLLKQPEVEVNKANNESATPLSVACDHGLIMPVVSLLKHEDIKVNAEGLADSTTPLFYACENGHKVIVTQLLKCPDIDVNKTTPEGSSPLAIAINNTYKNKDYVEIAKLLLEHPTIDIEQTTASGDTPLILAVDKLQVELVEKLLRKGANIYHAANDGTTAQALLAQHVLSLSSPEFQEKIEQIKELLHNYSQTSQQPVPTLIS